MSTNKKFSFTVLLCLLFLGWSAFPAAADWRGASGQTRAGGAENVIKIGVAADLSGDLENLGWPEANSAQLAADQINAAGGLDVGGVSYTIQLVLADSAGDDAAVLAAAQSLLDAGVVAVVGHTTSRECRLAQPLYFDARMAIISPSSTSPDVTRQGYDTTFRMPSHDGTPAKILAEFFTGAGLTRVAVVENFYPLAVDAFVEAFTASGGAITGRHTANDPSEFPAVLAAIQAEDPQGIVNFTLFPDVATFGDFSRQAFELGMTEVPIGWSFFENNEAVLAPYRQAAGAAAAEDDYAVFKEKRFSEMPGYAEFLADYLAAGFSHYPDDPTIYGAFAYDAVYLIGDAIQRAGSLARAGIRDAIADTQDFSGVFGLYEGFDQFGDILPQRGWIMGYQEGRWVQVFPLRLYLPVTVR